MPSSSRSSSLTELVIDETDLRIACRIIEAAIWYTTAEKVDLDMFLENRTT